MTSQSKKQRARIQTTGGTLLKMTGAFAAPPFKEFKLGGEVCRIILTAPIVLVEGDKFQIDAPTVWDIPFGDS